MQVKKQQLEPDMEQWTGVPIWEKSTSRLYIVTLIIQLICRVTIYSLDELLFLFGTSCCSMSSSNCCFLTCIQIYQEAGQVVWYSHLFQNFPQFVVTHTGKGFGIVNKSEVDVFLELSRFFYYYSMDIGNLISASSAFSKSILYICTFLVHELLKPCLGEFAHYFSSM